MTTKKVLKYGFMYICLKLMNRSIYIRFPKHIYLWLLQEKIMGCYQLMQELVINNNHRKPPKVLPQLRVTTRTRGWSSVSSSSSSPISSSSSVSSFSFSYKRRKLNNCLWVDDDKGNSEWREKRNNNNKGNEWKKKKEEEIRCGTSCPETSTFFRGFFLH